MVKMMVIVLILLPLMGRVADALQNTVIRPNYGVAMHRTSSANLASSTWGHTFVIPFLSKVPEPYEIDVPCARLPKDAAVDICKEMTKTAEEFKTSQEKLISKIEENMDLVKSLIPARINKQRRARGLLNFVGSVQKTLFGVATSSDIDQLQSNIDAYAKVAQLTTNEVRKTEKSLGSFMNLTDERITEAVASITDNQKKIDDLFQEAGHTNMKLDEIQVSVKVLLLLNRNIAETLLTLQQILFTTESWILGIQTLLEGFLPVQIVGHKKVQLVLDHVRAHLSSNTGLASYSLAHQIVSYYYQAQDILFSKDEDSLYISIKIPITAEAAFIDVYSVLSLSVPLNASTQYNSTLLVGLPHYFGITRNGEYYAEFDNDLYSSCVGNDVKFCPSMISVRARTSLSCMSAIFFDLPTKVHELCEIRYQNAPLYEGAFSLGDNHYLASGGKDESWSVICPNKSPAPIRSCNFCVIKLNCDCGLSSSTWKIFATAQSSCNNQKNKVTMLHTVNLPVLHALYSRSDISKIRGTTAFQTPLSVRMPAFNVKARNWTTVLEKDRAFSLDFKKMAKSLSKSGAVYASKSDELLDNAGSGHVFSMTSGSSIGTFLWNLINSILAGTALLLAIYLRCHRGAAALPLAAAALPLVQPYVIVTNDTVSLRIQEGMQQEMALIFTFEQWLLVMLCCLVVLLTGYRIGRASLYALRSRFGTINFGTYYHYKTWLVLELVTPSSSAKLWLVPVVGHPLEYEYLGDLTNSFDVGIRFLGCCPPQTLQFVWPSSSILRNRHSGQELPLPPMLRIITVRPSQFKRLLKSDYTCCLYLSHQGYNYPLQMRSICYPSAPAFA